MSTWNKLSMADRAKYIKLAVQNGVTNLDNIRNTYNKYTEGDLVNKFDDGGTKEGPTYDPITARWYNVNGDQLAVGHGYWSNAINKYVMYGTDGSVTKYTPIEWAEKKNKDYAITRRKLEREYSIPVDNRIPISQNNVKGNNKDRGALVSPNQVDSILKYANITNVSPYEALGLFAQESTFNNAHLRTPGYFYVQNNSNGTWTPGYISNKKNEVSPVLMGSIWSYIDDNPYNDYLKTLEKIKDPKEKRARALAGRRYLEKQVKKFNLYEPPLQYGLRLYKSGKYNTGDSNHSKDVKNRGNALKDSPEIVNMVNRSPFNK